jgi:predicted heme/steroid binding protein
LFTGCSGKKDEAAQSTPVDAGSDLTLEELAEYNGKDDNPAYIAVDGVIYDVSRNANWKSGEHNGYSAGNEERF